MFSPEEGLVPESVRRAMAMDISVLCRDDRQAIMSRIQSGLKDLLGTKEQVLVLPARLAGVMRAALGALFAPGEKVLVVEAGEQGLQFSNAAQAQGLEVVALPIVWGEAVKPKEVENALARWPDITAVLVQAVDLSTTVVHPVQDIARLCRQSGKMAVVDGTGLLGSAPFLMDLWGLDCVLCASGPGMLLPSGTSFLALSQRAGEKSLERGVMEPWPDDFQEDADLFEKFFPPVNMLFGLDESLRLLMLEGREKNHLRHKALAAMVRNGISQMGLDLLVQNNHALSASAVMLPPGIDEHRLLQTARDDYQVIMAGGQGRLSGRLVRIGHAGCIRWQEVLAGLLALHEAFLSCGGVSGSRDYLEKAWEAYSRTMDSAYD